MRTCFSPIFPDESVSLVLLALQERAKFSLPASMRDVKAVSTPFLKVESSYHSFKGNHFVGHVSFLTTFSTNI